MEKVTLEGSCLNCGNDLVGIQHKRIRSYAICVLCGSTEIHISNWTLRPLDWESFESEAISIHM